jgi:hypothetical protein
MDVGARLFQTVGEVVQLIVDRFNVQTFGSKSFRDCDQILPVRIETGDRVVEKPGRLNALGIVFGELAVTSGAQLTGTRGQHFVVSLFDRVIAVALTAFWPVMLIKRYFVFATIKQAGICGMTKTATATDLRDSGRTSRVVSMTGVTSRRAQIAALQRLAVNTRSIFRQLVGGQWRAVGFGEAGHCLFVGMTCAARFRDSLSINFGKRIFRWSNSMNAVTTHTGRRTIVVFLQQRSAVRTILELGQLIGRQRRVEVMHPRGIRVTSRAELNHPGAVLLPIFLRPLLDEIVPKIRARIAPMTAGA